MSTVLIAEALDTVGSVPNLGIAPPLKIEPSVDFGDLAKLSEFLPKKGESSKPDLRIIGVTGTSYIRAVVFGAYTNGGWKTTASDSVKYTGEVIPSRVTEYVGYESIGFAVRPLKGQRGYVPAVLNARRVDMSGILDYYQETQTFFSEGVMDDEYGVVYLKYEFDEERLRNTPLQEAPEYLQIPDELRERFREKAEEITRGHRTDYEKVRALTDYLKSNYVYNVEFQRAPPGYDPVEWFIFESKEGVCMEFNSALVLLARSIGLPGRLVGGYYVYPNAVEQDVYPDRRHAYSEFPFEGHGWVTFDATASVLEEGQGDSGEGEAVELEDGVQGGEQAEDAVDSDSRLPAECEKCAENTPLFSLEGEVGTSYLRNMVGEEYDGTWSMVDPAPTEYRGEVLTPSVSVYSECSTYGFQVVPVQEMGGFVPSALNARKLTVEWPTLRYEEQQVFFSERTFDTPYMVYYNRYMYTEEELHGVNPINDPRYMGVPDGLRGILRPLALSVTAGSDSPYEKLKALESYLRENYVYDEDFKHSPSNMDPVEWFLFHEGRGVCANFNSAFVLLARSIGLPARLVGGYLVDGAAESQTVGAKQRHAYSEVPFEGLGWVTFDATGLGNATTPVGEGGGEEIEAEEGEGEEVEGGLKPQEDTEKEDAVDTSTVSQAEGSLGSGIPLFTMYGAPGTTYLRNMVGEAYDGEWNISQPSTVEYTGGLLRPSVAGYSGVSTSRFIVEPIAEMGGFIPAPLHSTAVMTEGLLLRYVDEALFFSPSLIEAQYSVSCSLYTFDEGTLRQAEPILDDQYMGVPPELRDDLRALALTAAGGAETPYERLRALESYLRENYVYDPDYERAPSGFDPVEWFLFQEGRGVCSNFNSALVLLARSLGIPARLVSGYIVDPAAEVQNVTNSQRHSYAEAPFQGVGWIGFDATPVEDIIPSDSNGTVDDSRVPTITEITSQDATGVRGFEFVAVGTVTDAYGAPVDGLTTLVYVKMDKNETGLLCGQGDVVDGWFNTSCSVPLELEIGEYMVEAHTLGDSRYLESWSDPPLRIVQRTRMALDVPDRWITGRQFEFRGNLTDWWTGEPIGNEFCTLRVGDLSYTYVTDGEGVIDGIYTINAPGVYNITLSFPGTTYFLPSNETWGIRIIPPKIYQDPLETFVRLEGVDISGRVRAEDLPGDGEKVILTVDGQKIGTVTADDVGVFRFRYVVPASQELGDVLMGYTLESNDFSVNSLTNVVARTSISLRAPESVGPGDAFNITATLRDDLGAPMPEESVTIAYRTGSEIHPNPGRTDGSGEATLSLEYGDIGGASRLYYNASFPGSGLYIGSTASGVLNATTTGGTGGLGLSELLGNPVYLLLGVGVLALTGVGGYYLAYRREGGLQGLLEPAKASLETYVDGRTRVAVELLFPQIRPPLPRVWGVGEPLLVRARVSQHDGPPVEGMRIQVSFNGGDPRELTLDDGGLCETEWAFDEKGPIKVTARFPGDEALQPSKAEAELRIVDYREEVLDLYNEFSEEHRPTVDEIKLHFTAREAMHVLLKYTPPSVHAPLEEMTAIFEVADYSTHSIMRGEYERFYLAREEFRMDE